MPHGAQGAQTGALCSGSVIPGFRVFPGMRVTAARSMLHYCLAPFFFVPELYGVKYVRYCT